MPLPTLIRCPSRHQCDLLFFLSQTPGDPLATHALRPRQLFPTELLQPLRGFCPIFPLWLKGPSVGKTGQIAFFLGCETTNSANAVRSCRPPLSPGTQDASDPLPCYSQKGPEGASLVLPLQLDFLNMLRHFSNLIPDSEIS